MLAGFEVGEIALDVSGGARASGGGESDVGGHMVDWEGWSGGVRTLQYSRWELRALVSWRWVEMMYVYNFAVEELSTYMHNAYHVTYINAHNVMHEEST